MDRLTAGDPPGPGREGDRSAFSGRSRNVVQAGSVAGGVHFHDRPDGPGSDRPPRPRQLPGGVRGFVNRADELALLTACLGTGDRDGPGESVCVISGTAGVGKTALALRWAHQVRDRFPDGQLYADLRGYDPGRPAAAEEVLHRFLLSLGLGPAAVPPNIESAAALYRSVLADRRVLILLDNAATAAQVRPLLPGDPAAFVVVTSRARLSGLAVREGARRLAVGTLPEAEAVTLVQTVTRGFRSDDDHDAVSELARLCAGLPLALRIAAERAASRPHMGLHELIADLRDESALWDALTADDEEADAVRSVFAWSYRALPADAARLFRLLGLHPGTHFGSAAAAALAGTDARTARRLLDVLVGACVLEQTAHDRFRFHDLLRAYAADRAAAEDSVGDRSAALRRLLDWYLHTADAAQEWIEPAEERVPLDAPRPGVEPLRHGGYDAAVDWAEREEANLVPLVRAADRAGLPEYAWRLALVLWNARPPSSVAADWVPAGRAGWDAARRVEDTRAQARLLESLGFAHAQGHRLVEAADLHRRALALWRAAGDRAGEAAALNAIGLVDLRARRLGDARAHFAAAIATFTELGEAHWAAVALSNQADALQQAGAAAPAREAIERALTAHRDSGDRHTTGDALRILSAVRLDEGRPEAALSAAEEAVDLALDLRDHVLEAYWLLALGDARIAADAAAGALESFHRSAVLHRRLGDAVREARAWQGAGEAFRRLERWGDATAMFRRAAAVHSRFGDTWHEAAARVSLAIALERGGAADEAREQFAAAFGLLRGFSDVRAARLRASIASRRARGS